MCPLLPAPAQHHDWEVEEEGAPSEVRACNPSPLFEPTSTFTNTFSFPFLLASCSNSIKRDPFALQEKQLMIPTHPPTQPHSINFPFSFPTHFSSPTPHLFPFSDILFLSPFTQELISPSHVVLLPISIPFHPFSSSFSPRQDINILCSAAKTISVSKVRSTIRLIFMAFLMSLKLG